MNHLSDGELLDIVDNYADSHDAFNNSFACSLREALDEYDELTYNQREALENIVRRFRMLEDE